MSNLLAHACTKGGQYKKMVLIHKVFQGILTIFYILKKSIILALPKYFALNPIPNNDYHKCAMGMQVVDKSELLYLLSRGMIMDL